MKKTTYIIMALIAICLGGSFILPAAIFSEELPKEIRINKTGQIVEIAPGDFYGIQVDNAEIYNISQENYEIPLTIRISTSDSITSPKIYMDKSWSNNVNLLVTEDNILTISMSLDSLVENNINLSNDNIVSPEDNSLVAEIVIPSGWPLTQIEPRNLHLNLTGINEEKLLIAYAFAGIKMIDCEIPDLVIVN